MSIKMIRGLLKFKHTRLFFTPRTDVPKESPKPHEIAEAEELDIAASKENKGEHNAHLMVSGMNGVFIPVKPNPKFDVEKMKWTTSIS